MDKISVLIIEDHKLFSETLVIMVNCDTRFEITGRTDTEEALEYLRLKRTDIVLLDIHLGKVSGLDLIKSIQILHPAVKVLVLSSSHQTAFVKGMMKEGAKGYLNKNVN